MYLKRSKHCHITVIIAAVSIFLILLVFHYAEKVQYIIPSAEVPVARLHQVSCEEEMEKFWNTPVTKINFITADPSCINSKSSHGSSKSQFEDFLVPQNFKHLPECKPVSVDYYPSPHPQIALASFPGSGNTWARYLIEYMTGIYTGSIYCGIIKSRFKAECDHLKNNYTIVVKTHRRTAQKYDGAVLILRNPYDAMFAQYNRRHAGKTNTVSESDLNSTSWHEYVFRASQGWRNHVVYWLTEVQGPLHILSYEGMKNNFFREMYNLASFLNVTVTYLDLWCLNKNKEGFYHRQKLLQPNYSADHRKAIDNHILEVKELLREKYSLELPF